MNNKTGEKTDDELNKTVDELETEVRETLENPYNVYSVKFPYECSFSIPDDGYKTGVTINTTSEKVMFGRNDHDVSMQLELDQEHGRPTNAKHILDWLKGRMFSIDPREVTVTYGDGYTIDPMTDEEIDEFREVILNEL